MLLPFDETRFASQVAELGRLRTSLDARPLVIGWRDRLASDLMAEAVQSSTSLEGVPVTVEEVRRILAGDRPANVSVEDAALVTGYRDAMAYCQRRADDDVFTWSPELIKAIQDSIVAGRLEALAGRYGKGRFVQNNVTGELIYGPPQDDVNQLVEQLCARMNDKNWNAHPALKSAWVHVALAAIHPFKDGNGRTARVLASLAMYRGDFKRREFTSLEEWWGRHRDDYYQAFTCLGPTFDPNADVTPFVEAHVNAQVTQVRIRQNVERVQRRVFDGIAAVVSQLGLHERTEAALWEAFWDRVITRPYYLAVAGVKEATGTKDLNELVAAGLLRAEGQTRGRHWRRGERFFAILGAQFGLDPEHSNRQSIISLITDQVISEAQTINDRPGYTTAIQTKIPLFPTSAVPSTSVVSVSGTTSTSS